MKDKIVRAFARAAPSSDVSSPGVDVVASTADMARDGLIIEQDWDLAAYLANPVVLYAHNATGGWSGPTCPEDTLPIGYAENVRVEDGALKARLRFVDADANPLAPKVAAGFAQGSLRAVSVGWIPKNCRIELRDGEEVPVMSGCELLEISVVPIPADPRAVAEARALQLDNARAHARSTMEVPMEWKVLAAMLGLAATATETDVQEAARAFRATGDELLKVTGKRSVPEALGAISAWRAEAEKVPALAEELRAIRAEKSEAEVRAILDAGAADGRVTPAQRGVFLESCGANEQGLGADPKRLRALVDALHPTGALAPPHTTPIVDPKVPAVTEEQRRANKLLGVKDSDFIATQTARATNGGTAAKWSVQ